MKKDITFKEITIKRIDDMKIKYIDENEYRKLLRGLREINKLAYKQIVLKKIEFDKTPGKHEAILNSSEIFKKVHGDVKLIYSTYNDTVVIENIEPSRVLIEYHNKKKNTYNGIPFVDDKDVFKINLLREMKK